MYSYLEIVAKKPDITEFYQHFVIAHRSIGEMCQWKRDVELQHLDRMREFYARYKNTQDTPPEVLQPCHREYMPILHHVLDWMVSTIPAELYKKKPLYIFAVAWRAMYHLHNWIGHDIVPEDFYYINEYELPDFIRSTGISLQGYRYKEDARFGMEAFLYYREDIDGSLFFPILTAKNDQILSERMDRLRIANAEKFEEEYTS